MTESEDSSASTVSSPACSPGSSPACSPGSSPACSPGSSPACSPGSSPADSLVASPQCSPVSSLCSSPGSSPTVLPKSPIKKALPVKRPTLVHPSTAVMVNTAIKSLKDKKGSTLPAIKKYMAINYQVDLAKFAPYIRRYLKSAVAKGELIQTNGTGATGNFKLPAADKKPASKKAGVPVVNKKSGTKKLIAKQPTVTSGKRRSIEAGTTASTTVSKAKKPKKVPTAVVKPKTKKTVEIVIKTTPAKTKKTVAASKTKKAAADSKTTKAAAVSKTTKAAAAGQTNISKVVAKKAAPKKK